MRLFEKFNRFMYGRYGPDQLGRFLVILSLVFWAACLVLRFTPLRRLYFVFWLLNTALYVYAIFRFLSKNTWQRSVENERYLRLRERFLPFFRGVKDRVSDREHVFRRCKFCKTRLRLKRVPGRHTTRCPQCGESFKVFILF